MFISLIPRTLWMTQIMTPSSNPIVEKTELSRDPIEQFNQLVSFFKEEYSSNVLGEATGDRTGPLALRSNGTKDNQITAIIKEDRVVIATDTIKKEITIDNFYGILSGYISKTEKTGSLLLPFGCFKILNYANGNKDFYCYYPEARKTITHTSSRSSSTKKTYDIPFPNLVIVFSLATEKVGTTKFKVVSVKYLATKLTPAQIPDNLDITGQGISRATGMALLPFTNFYGDGGMCYGGNVMPVKFTNNLRGLDYYYQVIFVSPFNDDLGLKAMNAVDGLKTETPSSFYNSLTKFKTFPYEALRTA
jgi:hypothetical protein